MILVTGASGFVGSHLVKRLVERGRNLRCFDLYFPKKLTHSFQFVRGSLTDINLLSQITKDIEIIIHLAAVNKSTLANRINVIGTQNLVNCALKDRVKKFIFISSTDAIFRETIYGMSKFKAESIIKSSDMKFVILRPSTIYGKNDKVISKLINLIRYSLIIPMIKDQEYKLQPVYIEDVISAIISAVGTEKAENKTYTIAGLAPITFKEMVNKICRALNIKRKIIYIPEFYINLARIYLRSLAKQEFLLHLLLSENKDRTYDIQPAVRDLSYKPIPFEEGLMLALKAK